MQFFVIQNAETGETIGCELTRKTAVETTLADGIFNFDITMVEVDGHRMNEVVRRLLGCVGGYARKTETYQYRDGKLGAKL